METKRSENKTIAELQVLTESEKRYRCNERLEDFHARNYDWKRVMEDKWHLLIQTGGSL